MGEGKQRFRNSGSARGTVSFLHSTFHFIGGLVLVDRDDLGTLLFLLVAILPWDTTGIVTTSRFCSEVLHNHQRRYILWLD